MDMTNIKFSQNSSIMLRDTSGGFRRIAPARFAEEGFCEAAFGKTAVENYKRVRSTGVSPFEAFTAAFGPFLRVEENVEAIYAAEAFETTSEFVNKRGQYAHSMASLNKVIEEERAAIEAAKAEEEAGK